MLLGNFFADCPKCCLFLELMTTFRLKILTFWQFAITKAIRSEVRQWKLSQECSSFLKTLFLRENLLLRKKLIAKSLCLGLFDSDCHQFLVLIALRFDEISSKLVLEEKKQTNTNLEQWDKKVLKDFKQSLFLPLVKCFVFFYPGANFMRQSWV